MLVIVVYLCSYISVFSIGVLSYIGLMYSKCVDSISCSIVYVDELYSRLE